MSKKKTSVYNYATGKHQKAAAQMDTSKWWNIKMGFGEERGKGALAKRRKKAIDSNVRKATK